MIPLYKLFAVTARLFTKPLVTIFKKRHKSSNRSKNSVLEKLFIFLGNREYKFDLWLNRRLLNIEEDGDMFMKPLNEEVALEKGIEFFYEILIYSILILITVLELVKYSKDQEAKKIREEARFEKMSEERRQLQSNLDMQVEQLTAAILGLKRSMELVESNTGRLSELNSQAAKLGNKSSNSENGLAEGREKEK